MRYLRIVLTLVFGLVMVGPEAHACPVHDQSPAHHQHGSSHHQRAHCTCPQACCHTCVGAALPTRPGIWTDVPSPVMALELESAHPAVLPPRLRLFPFALAPPPRS